MAPTDIKCQTVIEKCAEFSFELVYTQFCLNQQVLKVRVHVLFVLVSQGRFFERLSLWGYVCFILKHDVSPFPVVTDHF